MSLVLALVLATVMLASCGGGGQESSASSCKSTSTVDGARRLIVGSVPGFQPLPPSPSSGDADDGVKAGTSGGLVTGVEQGFHQGADLPLLRVNALCYGTQADAQAVYKDEIQNKTVGVTSGTEVASDLPGTVLLPAPEAQGGTAVIDHKNVIILIDLDGEPDSARVDATIRAVARGEIELLNRLR